MAFHAIVFLGGYVIESLEPRLLMAGVVTAEWVDATLTLRGDDGSNSIQISRSSDGNSISVIGHETLINGQAALSFPLHRLRGLDVDLGHGDDGLLITNLRTRGPARVAMGDGNDALHIRHSRFAGNLVALGGSGSDAITLRDTTIQGQARLEGQSGRDVYIFSRLLVKRSFSLRDMSGGSVLHLNRLSVRGDGGIRLGTALDDVTLDSSTFSGQALIDLGVGVDRATIRGSVFHGSNTLPHPDDPDDDVHREILLGWDFNDGLQGWTPGFANYPKGQVVGTDAEGRPVYAEEAYILEAGIEPLPPDLDSQRAGLLFTFRNLSDRLRSYMVLRLGSEDGVEVEGQYQLQMDIVFSTRLPSDPGTILAAYIGAAPEAPEVQQSPRDPDAPFLYEITNIDLGNLLVPGYHGSFAGHVHNGLPQENPAWGATRVTHTHPLVYASLKGDLYLIVLIGSSYETRQQFYIHSTRAWLVPT